MTELSLQPLPVATTLEDVGVLGDALRIALLDAGVDDQFAFDLELAVVEAATNIIAHAYDGAGRGEVKSGYRIDDDQIVVELLDRGRPFPGALVPDAPLQADGNVEDLAESGRGLSLMALLVDAVRRRRIGDTNITQLTRRRPCAPPASGQNR